MSKKEESETWLVGYCAIAGTIGATGVVPGTTTAPLIALQIAVSFHIGRIYRGDAFTLEEAKVVFEHVGLTAIIGRTLAYELLGFIPIAGWLIKSGVAGSATAFMGKLLISFYEEKYGKSPVGA